MWRRLFLDSPPDWQLAALVVVPTALIAWIGARSARRLATIAMRHLLRDTVATSSPLIKAPLRLIGAATFVLLFAVLVFPGFEIAGLHPRAGLHLGTLSSWVFDSGLRVLLIVAVGYALIRVVAVGVKRFEHDINFGTGLDALERAKRAKTLGSILSNMTTVVVIAIATLDGPQRVSREHLPCPDRRRHRRGCARLRRPGAGARLHRRVLLNPRKPGPRR
jgi:hypothetical protein